MGMRDLIPGCSGGKHTGTILCSEHRQIAMDRRHEGQKFYPRVKSMICVTPDARFR